MIEEILKKIKELPDEYWEEVYKKIDDDREVKIEDLIALLTYLFADAESAILQEIGLYYLANNNELDYVVNNKRITKNDIAATQTLLYGIVDELAEIGLELDKDIKLEIDNLNTRTSQLENLKVKLRTYLNNLYVRSNSEVMGLMEEVVEDLHDHTIYEVFKAAGKGSDKPKKLTDEELALILAMFWRSTEETFDDAIWRYGRAFIVELEQLLGQALFLNMSENELADLISKMFRNKLNELKNLIHTDATYYSTKGEARAFEDLDIKEARFTAILDERTSDMCREADGNVIPIEDITPWENAPPLHYWCRSTMVPIIDNLDFLDGDNVYNMDNLDFDGWYDQYYSE